MPAKPIAINLLGQEDLKHTPQGRIISWALTYGRYIMIGTEIVVLLAFISRFSLDRKLTDLKEEISQKQAILEANVDLERDIRLLQDELVKIKQTTSGQSVPLGTLTLLQAILPADVYVETLDIATDRLSVAAVAASTYGFSQFLTNLQAAKQFSRIDIGDIKKNASTGIEFKFTAYLSNKTK
ncbi:PilN domain-containing protein [Candidatus Gottesmanbacteria bacterium]|nr:PilN domain-containing protein [Candidatus Gottesmanbacteria bacterium]